MERTDRRKICTFLFGFLAVLLCLSVVPADAGRVLFTNYHNDNCYAVQVSVQKEGGTREDNVCSTPRDQHDIVLGTGAVTRIIVIRPDRECLEGDFRPVKGTVLREYDVSGDPAANRSFRVTIKADATIVINERK